MLCLESKVFSSLTLVPVAAPPPLLLLLAAAASTPCPGAGEAEGLADVEARAPQASSGHWEELCLPDRRLARGAAGGSTGDFWLRLLRCVDGGVGVPGESVPFLCEYGGVSASWAGDAEHERESRSPRLFPVACRGVATLLVGSPAGLPPAGPGPGALVPGSGSCTLSTALSTPGGWAPRSSSRSRSGSLVPTAALQHWRLGGRWDLARSARCSGEP